jgi:hypothetical protein
VLKLEGQKTAVYNTGMDPLGKIFKNETRVKLLRFVILNNHTERTLFDLEKLTNISLPILKREIELLKKVGVVKTKKVKVERKKRTTATLSVWLNHDYKYINAFKEFFVTTNPLSTDTMVKRLSQAGSIKLLVVSGVFIENPESRLDLLIVGDKLDKEAIDKSIQYFESTLGRELRYASMETIDFSYRISMYDKLIRDILDYPHRKILNRIGI